MHRFEIEFKDDRELRLHLWFFHRHQDVDALNEDGYSKTFISNLPKRVRPSLKQYKL
jgi:hypothetical protein